MDIPYTVKPREDTGLFNAKVGIWLFLASEVMLFGGLFSSYILLRVGAEDGSWPHGWLNVPLGTANTIVLIVSSVTVVMAWASLKMNQFSKFKLYQGLTVLCALIFLVIKTFEYNDKFTHYAVLQKDGSYVDGHLVTKKMNAAGTVLESITLHGMQTKDINQIVDPHKHRKEKHEHKEFTIAGTNIVRFADVAKVGQRIAFRPVPSMKDAAGNTLMIGNRAPRYNTYTAIYFTLTGLHALHVLGGAIVIGFLWGPGAAMWRTEPERFTNRVEVSGLFWHFVDLVWIFLFPVLYLL